MPGALDPGLSTNYKAVGEDLVKSSSKLVLDTILLLKALTAFLTVKASFKMSKLLMVLTKILQFC